MSNQNKKNRVRRRQQKTGKKYTEALREQQRREAMADQSGTRGLIAKLARESRPNEAGVDIRVLSPDDLEDLRSSPRERCSACDGELRWVSIHDLRDLRPAAFAEIEAVGIHRFQAEAWVCLECDDFGVLSVPVFDWADGRPAWEANDDAGADEEADADRADENGFLDFLMGDLPETFEEARQGHPRLWHALTHCQDCGTRLDWVDPASVAYSHREAFLKAKKEFGAGVLLGHGSAAVCGACGRVDFHPHSHL